MKLVIISGAPASGKTTIGTKIARTMGYEFLSKDALKEALFDSESRSTHDYFWYEKRAKSTFFDMVKDLLSKNKSVVIESNFMSMDKQKLLACLNKRVKVVEIYCFAKGHTRLQRFIKRNETKARHEGHHDRRWYVTILSGVVLYHFRIKWPYGPMNITDKKLSIDTTDFSKVNYEDITAFVQSA